MTCFSISPSNEKEVKRKSISVGMPSWKLACCRRPRSFIQEDFKENGTSQESSQALEVSQPPGASVSLCVR